MHVFANIRRIVVILLVSVWGVMGVVAPAHATEEDIHHATQHAEFEGFNSIENGEKESVVHPEHAAHCHAGTCHFHLMGRGSISPTSIFLALLGFSLPQLDIVQQTDPLGLFHPPRF